ncbi:MAG: hypothetical protein WBL63_09870 [Candidatus Acidiferrum sp.]
MIDGLIVQYVGFQAKLLAREYTFHVRGSGEDREFTLNIANEAFVSHRARYQDAPGICAERLQAELAAHQNHPAETEFVITAAELDSYRIARAPKSPRSLYGRPAQQDF